MVTARNGNYLSTPNVAVVVQQRGRALEGVNENKEREREREREREGGGGRNSHLSFASTLFFFFVFTLAIFACDEASLCM